MCSSQNSDGTFGEVSVDATFYGLLADETFSARVVQGSSAQVFNLQEPQAKSDAQGQLTLSGVLVDAATVGNQPYLAGASATVDVMLTALIGVQGGGPGTGDDVTAVIDDSGCPVLPPVTDTDLTISASPPAPVDATGPDGATVTWTAPTVTDPDDTNPPVAACSPSSGGLFAIGTTTVTCTATDSDDSNGPVSSTFTVTVNGAAQQLSALATTVGNTPSPGSSLSDKVALVQQYLADGDVADACPMLGSLVNEVQAQSGKKLTADQANGIIADATRIEAVLGC